MEKLNLFLTWLSNEGKDEKTITAYKGTVGQFLKWYEETNGHQVMNKVLPIDIKEYISFMKHTLNRKQATINKTIASLKTFFGYLTYNKHIIDNPMTRIKIQKVNNSENIGEKISTKWLTKEEQERFLTYVDLEKNVFNRLRNLAVIDIMLYAGLRVSEVEQLKIEDIKINGDTTITIRDGKQGKYANVTLISKYSKNLRQWMKYRKTSSKSIHIHSPYLFVSERSQSFGARGIQVMLNKYAALANMNNITPHRFRHSFCKNLSNSGTSIEIIKRLARHENIQTTSIYVDPSFQEQLSALKKM